MTMDSRRNLLKLIAAGGLAAGAVAMSQGGAQAQQSGESTLERIRRTGELRVSILAGEAPFFIKNLAENKWEGTGIDMANDIAAALDVKLTIIESSTATAIADVQTGKADLAFPFNQSPQRALAVRFTETIYSQGIVAVGPAGFTARTWADLSKPEVRIATVIGGLADRMAQRYSPQAKTTGYKTRDDMIVAVQSGRADTMILAMLQGLGVRAKFPQLESINVLNDPAIVLPSSLAIPKDADYEWRDFLNAWIQSVRGSRQFQEWLFDGFKLVGLPRDKVPSDVVAAL